MGFIRLFFLACTRMASDFSHGGYAVLSAYNGIFPTPNQELVRALGYTGVLVWPSLGDA
jgi:hypothetical protein